VDFAGASRDALRGGPGALGGGAQVAVFRGGHNAVTGEQSIITVNSIIGTKGVPNINPFDLKPGLTNGKLFARDRNVCAYCGDHFTTRKSSPASTSSPSRRTARTTG
jgi:transposase-like protein